MRYVYDGSFTYRPRRLFASVDSFTYAADDGNGRSEAATVIIVVRGEDPLPVVCEELAVSPEIHVLCSVLRLLPEESQPGIERIIQRYSDFDDRLEIEFKHRRGDRWELIIRLPEDLRSLDRDHAEHGDGWEKIRIDLDSELEDEWRYWADFQEGHNSGEADDD